MNQIGRRLRLTLFGESHGVAIGGVLDGVPPGLPVDLGAVQARLDARRPGTGPLVSARQETDEPEILSGVHHGRTTGAPLAFLIRNQDRRSQDYADLARTPRPGHSDWVAHAWSRGAYDPRGGGHYSGRLTACLVAAAALIEPMLHAAGIQVQAHLHAVGEHSGPGGEPGDLTAAAASPVHTAHALEDVFIDRIMAARAAKDSIGGTVAWKATGVPIAWGDPMFDSVESLASHMLFSVPAVKAVSFGAGFGAVAMAGSQHNDAYRMDGDTARPTSNHAGGILGGRTTGAPMWGHVAIKPTSSIFQPQETVDLERGTDATLNLKGRHDPCIAVRAVPVVRAAMELVLADLLLLAQQEGHA